MKKSRKQFLSLRCVAPGLVAAMAVLGASNLTADHHKDEDRTKGFTALGAEKQDKKEASFIKEAAKSGKKEIALGRMAADKAQNAQVKQFAQRLHQDHTKANQELMQIAQKHDVNLTEKHEDALTDHGKKEDHFTKLEDKTGAEFDKAFIEQALMHHQKDIQKYQQALKDCEDTELKAYIQKTLPVLRQHLEMARNAGRVVGVDQETLSAADQFLSDRDNAGSVGTGLSTERGTGSSANPGTTPAPLDNDK